MSTEFAIIFAQIVWPFCLIASAVIYLITKVIFDEIEYRKFRRENEETTHK